MPKYFVFFLLLLFYSCSSTNNSPCILQATYDSGATSSFNFRQDGTFKWTNGSGLGVSTEEGKYILKDTIIILDKIGFDKVIKSDRLLITSRHPISKNIGNFVIQVDYQNKLIDSMFIFTVYVDKRIL